jgi:hypothetical protein
MKCETLALTKEMELHLILLPFHYLWLVYLCSSATNNQDGDALWRDCDQGKYAGRRCMPRSQAYRFHLDHIFESFFFYGKLNFFALNASSMSNTIIKAAPTSFWYELEIS